jgi:hypothetical protein
MSTHANTMTEFVYESANDSLFDGNFSSLDLLSLMDIDEDDLHLYDDFCLDGNDSVRLSRDRDKCLFAEDDAEVLQVGSDLDNVLNVAAANAEQQQEQQQQVQDSPVNKLEPSTTTSGLTSMMSIQHPGKNIQHPGKLAIEVERFLKPIAEETSF